MKRTLLIAILGLALPALGAGRLRGPQEWPAEGQDPAVPLLLANSNGTGLVLILRTSLTDGPDILGSAARGFDLEEFARDTLAEARRQGLIEIGPGGLLTPESRRRLNNFVGYQTRDQLVPRLRLSEPREAFAYDPWAKGAIELQYAPLCVPSADGSHHSVCPPGQVVVGCPIYGHSCARIVVTPGGGGGGGADCPNPPDGSVVLSRTEECW